MSRFGEGNLTSEISLFSIIRDIITRWYLLLLAAAMGFMATEIVIDQTYEAEYTSSIVLVVSAKDSSNTAYSNLSLNREIASVFIKVLESDELADRINEYLGVSTLPGSITATQLGETNLLQIDAVSTSPERAFQLIKAVIEVHGQVSDYVFSNAVLDIMTDPVMATSPSNPKQTERYQKIAAIVCSLAMLALIVFLSIMRDTVKSPTYLTNHVDAKHLATLRHERKYRTVKSRIKRRKAPILITNPIISRGHVEEIQKLYMQLEHLSREKGYKVFMITSTCENEGKSTIAANLAIAGASSGRKVLLMDGDFRKPSVYKLLDIEKGSYKGSESYLSHRDELSECIQYVDRFGISVLMPERSHKNSAELVSTRRMSEMIRECREEFDVILLDTPPASVLTDAEIMAPYCDAVMPIVRFDFAYVCDINDTIDHMKNTKVIGCVLNNYRHFGRIAEDRYYGK
ncbi:MAG: CpsD/CapB family tyrosine-protein kinase [Clostridia bacterium]|nr:CpsD/CapB family tyrosine-protein kinase [Clostridia bacterium]